MGLRSAAGEVIRRIQWAAQHGLTFRGKRDLYEALGYKRVLTFPDYAERYARGDIAARIVEAFPDATWRGVGAVYDDEDPKATTTFEKTWQDLDKRFHFWSRFHQADILAGIGSYSAILLGLPGDLDRPLPTSGLNTTSLAYLRLFSEGNAKVVQYVDDLTDPRYGQPLFYQLGQGYSPALNQTSNARPVLNITEKVHYSRVVHLADGTLDDDVFGTSRLEKPWNRLDDIDKCVGGGSEAYWVRVHQGFQVDIDAEAELSPEDGAKLTEDIDDFVHNQRRFVKTRGVKMTPFGSDVTMFGQNLTALVSLISATTKIPQRLLMGSERGELASTQDRAAWTERVNDRRQSFAEPKVVRQFVDKLIGCGVLPPPVNAEYQVDWPEVLDMSLDERLTMAGQAKGLGKTIITDAEIRDEYLGKEPLTDDQLAESARQSAIITPVGLKPDGTPASGQPPKPPVDPVEKAPNESETAAFAGAGRVQ